jgi:hypothetical protein
MSTPVNRVWKSEGESEKGIEFTLALTSAYGLAQISKKTLL